MRVTEIFLKDYRNFAELKLDLSEGINIFLGRNAQGKTNILEAVYFASVLRSRAVKFTDLISWDKDAAFVKIGFRKAEVSQEVAVELSARKRSRRLFVNGEMVRSKSFVGRLNSVIFAPEDLFMFRGSPAGRRQFRPGVPAVAPRVVARAYHRLLPRAFVASRLHGLRQLADGTPGADLDDGLLRHPRHRRPARAHGKQPILPLHQAPRAGIALDALGRRTAELFGRVDFLHLHLLEPASADGSAAVPFRSAAALLGRADRAGPDFLGPAVAPHPQAGDRSAGGR